MTMPPGGAPPSPSSPRGGACARTPWPAPPARRPRAPRRSPGASPGAAGSTPPPGRPPRRRAVALRAHHPPGHALQARLERARVGVLLLAVRRAVQRLLQAAHEVGQLGLPLVRHRRLLPLLEQVLDLLDDEPPVLPVLVVPVPAAPRRPPPAPRPHPPCGAAPPPP